MRLLFSAKAMKDASGGAQRVLADVINGLARRGHELFLLTFDSPGDTFFYPIDPRVRRIGLGIGSTNRPATATETLQRIRAIRAAVRAESPEVAIGFMHSMYIPLGLALAGTGVPVIASEHIVFEHYRQRWLERCLLRMVPFLAARITCVSEQARDTYSAALRKKMIVIANPVTVRGGRADVCGNGRARKLLLAVGRLEAQKDHATLIAAFAKLAPQFPDWDLRIIGEGQLRPRLTAQIAASGLESRVKMPGATSDVAAEYSSAQLFVVPSRYESFGLTTAEAFGYGLPAVGFEDCEGTNELIRSGVNGLLARGGRSLEARAESLAAALAPLMSNEALRMKLSRAATLSDEWTINSVLDCWERFIAEVIDERRGP